MHFTGDLAWLSNFYVTPQPIKVWFVGPDSIKVPTVEHAYQFSKCNKWEDALLISLERTPGGAKRLGRSIEAREGWADMRVSIMYDLLLQKFSMEPLRTQLSKLEGPIVETNHWHDNFWGICECPGSRCDGQGENMLGQLLELVRAKIQYVDLQVKIFHRELNR